MPSNLLNELFHKLILAIPPEGKTNYTHTHTHTHTTYIHKHTHNHVDRHLIVTNISGEDLLKIGKIRGLGWGKGR